MNLVQILTLLVEKIKMSKLSLPSKNQSLRNNFKAHTVLFTFKKSTVYDLKFCDLISDINRDGSGVNTFILFCAKNNLGNAFLYLSLKKTHTFINIDSYHRSGFTPEVKIFYSVAAGVPFVYDIYVALKENERLVLSNKICLDKFFKKQINLVCLDIKL